jgi:hypothetical protein
MGMPEPTIVCGRGTGRSGIATDTAGFGAASAALAPASATAGAVCGATLAEALALAAPLDESFFSSQAVEASKITGTTQASQRMRVD